jgi:predicted alpha/beta-fold hydrolase
VSDNPDRAGDFVADAETLAATTLTGKDVEKIYLNHLGAAATRSQIVQAFDDGASLMNYIGHGGIHLWADEDIFNNDDVKTLALQNQQPLLLTMNCLNGYFHFPYMNALSEELLKTEGKGAVAAFSPSGLSVNSAAHVFHRLLLAELVSGQHTRLGDAVLAAQSAYADSGALPEMMAIYHLFGDPRMRVQ